MSLPTLLTPHYEFERGSNIKHNVTFALTPWNTVLGKLIVAHLIKILPCFHGTRRFITVYTKAQNWPRPHTVFCELNSDFIISSERKCF